jgi:hypothetical protein
MGDGKTIQQKIDALCVEYNSAFSLETFLNLVIFAARNLGVLDSKINTDPLEKLKQDYEKSKLAHSFGEVDKLKNLFGTMATVFFYLKSELGDLLYYRKFIHLVVKYIGQRDPNLVDEMKTEQVIFLSMVYQPMRWYLFLGQHEADIQNITVHAHFTDYPLPDLRTLRFFLLDFINAQCCHEIQSILHKDGKVIDTETTKNSEMANTKVAAHLLTWLNDSRASLSKEDYDAVMSGQLGEVKERLQPLFSKRLGLG